MREGEGSRTAERVAMRRALHQLIDRPLVFEDPLALAVVGPTGTQRLRADPASLDRSVAARSLRAFLAVRSRIAEEEVGRAVERGVRQYVIVGAGFDTFAYRNPYAAKGLRVFEVDHPATQARKRARLTGAKILGAAPRPDLVTFVAADLGEVPLGRALDGAGFDAAAASIFSWLGVVPYLELPAIRATLAFVGSLPGASLVFDYGVPPASLDWLTRLAVWRMGRRVAAIGEPWKTFFLPEEVRRELAAAGFGSIEDLGPDELDRRYFAHRSDRLRVGKVGHVVVASTGRETATDPSQAHRTSR